MSLPKDEILDHIKQVLTDLFEVEAEQVALNSRIYEDLDIDSIDTIDLLIELKRILKKDIDPQAFKGAQTIGDVVTIIAAR